MTAGQRFARLATELTVRVPALWPLLRPAVRRQFDRLAPVWSGMQAASRLEPYEAALAAIPEAPGRALDLGTGTGAGALRIARRWPETEVVGADFAPAMVEEARRIVPPELAGRIHFEVADASRLPYADGSFELVGLANMIPFPGELARVLAPGGHLVVAFSLGASTPIYLPPARLRRVLQRHGFTHVADFAAGDGVSLLARRAGPG